MIKSLAAPLGRGRWKKHDKGPSGEPDGETETPSTSVSIPDSNLSGSDSELSADSISEERMVRISFVESQLLSVFSEEEPGIETDLPLLSRRVENAPVCLPIHQPFMYPCHFSYDRLPPGPETWPQRPLMVREMRRTSSQL
jgi:hypothetical protein